MDTAFETQAADRLQVHLTGQESAFGLSGSRIHFATRHDGTPCVLKVTSLREANDARAGQRELTFYRDIASQVPVRTPDLLGVYEERNMIALLLSRHGSVEPALSWDPPMWRALATDLAHLHDTTPAEARNWSVEDEARFRPLRNPDIAMVEDFWRDDLAGTLDAILASREALEREILHAGMCFLHGDCHTENILREGDDLVWIDWQGTRMGNPALELAFLHARVTPSGAQVPAWFLDAYCSGREIELEQIRRSVIAAELSIFVFEWPPYTLFDTQDGTSRVRRRTRYLAEQWLNLVSAM
jgi:aminoglycoside phosphotransferase (APT) family kinase protein